MILTEAGQKLLIEERGLMPTDPLFLAAFAFSTWRFLEGLGKKSNLDDIKDKLIETRKVIYYIDDISGMCDELGTTIKNHSKLIYYGRAITPLKVQELFEATIDLAYQIRTQARNILRKSRFKIDGETVNALTYIENLLDENIGEYRDFIHKVSGKDNEVFKFAAYLLWRVKDFESAYKQLSMGAHRVGKAKGSVITKEDLTTYILAIKTFRIALDNYHHMGGKLMQEFINAGNPKFQV